MAMACGTAALAGESNPPAQAARGQAMFFTENVVTHCGSCHSLAGKGTAVGPDLTRLARLSPSAIVMAIRATLTEHVQVVKLKSGGSEFPAMPAATDTSKLQYYDLSSQPPALRRFNSEDIAYIHNNEKWKHPPASAGYTAQQLADVIAYIKWVSYGDTKGVSPDDIE
jgi:mono/diheme cytochrome c family protein